MTSSTDARTIMVEAVDRLFQLCKTVPAEDLKGVLDPLVDAHLLTREAAIYIEVRLELLSRGVA